MDFNKAVQETKTEFQDPTRLAEEKEVIEKYGQMFHPDNLDNLTKEGFKSFLLIKNNRHWEGIHRQENLITSDMNRLRRGLKVLLDESKPIKDRLDKIFPKNKPSYIKGLGRAIVTPILLVVYPEKYGAYNRRSAEGLKKVGLEPKLKRGASFAERYMAINDVLKRLAAENEMTLFQFDSVWWRVTEGYKPVTPDEELESEELSTGFGLETHLRRFIVDNWDRTPFGKKYDLLAEDGEVIGEEFRTDNAGIIDILARDKKNKDWIIIELKKAQSSDAVIGQTLRYMGWTQQNKIEKKEAVRGIIVVKEVDEKLKYALSALPQQTNLECYEYNVQFSLKKV